MSILYELLKKLNELFDDFLSDIRYVNLCDEWSDFYPIVDDESLEFYKLIIKLEYIDAGRFEKSDYDLFIGTLNDVFYVNNLLNYYELRNDDNAIVKLNNELKKVIEASNRFKEIYNI